YGCRLVRAVPVRPVRRRADRRRRLAECVARLRWAAALHRPYGARARDSTECAKPGRIERAPIAITDERARRGVRSPLLRASRLRLLHLRLPACVHHATPSLLSDRSGLECAGGRLGARHHRAVQHHWLDLSRLALDALSASISAGDQLFPA